MTKLLQRAVEKLALLPEERQDELAKMLIDVAAQDLQPHVFTDKERAAVEEALEQVERGEFATDAEVAAMWNKFGL